MVKKTCPMKKLFSVCLGATLLAGCQLESPLALSDDRVAPGNCAVCGTWTYSGYEQRGPNQYLTVYTRTTAFTNQAGLQFSGSGQFVERANSGWCGTPPISYADYTGRWRPDGDSLAVDGNTGAGGNGLKLPSCRLTQPGW